jgi:hydrogenase maturation protein HypF
VVLSGGVFMNALLSLDAESALGREGFDVYRHRLVPPGDGGLSLGQAAIAASRLAEK